MAKFSNRIGFSSFDFNPGDGTTKKEIIEKTYRGDILNNVVRWDETTQVSDDLKLNQRVSIIADGFALDNSSFIVYAVINGTKWKVNSIEINRPRMILNIGGIYNEQSS